MALVNHAEHIVNLALQPVRSQPNARDRRNLFVSGHLHAQTQASVPLERLQMVDNVEAFSLWGDTASFICQQSVGAALGAL